MATTDRIHLERNLTHILSFLDQYLPLANAHVADFLICDYWERFIPKAIQKDLLALNESELAKLPSSGLYTADTEHLQTNCAINTSKSNDNEDNDKNSLVYERKLWDRTKIPQWHCKDLKTFILQAQSLTLPYVNVLSNLNDLLQKWQPERSSKTVIKEFMSEKKSHEVDIMAELCAVIASFEHLGKVIDIGSGRGYLSSHLSLMHSLSVLAVDSSNINTKSAQTRSQRLEKHWTGIVRNAKKLEGATKKKHGQGKTDPFSKSDEHNSVSDTYENHKHSVEKVNNTEIFTRESGQKWVKNATTNLNIPEDFTKKESSDLQNSITVGTIPERKDSEGNASPKDFPPNESTFTTAQTDPVDVEKSNTSFTVKTDTSSKKQGPSINKGEGKSMAAEAAVKNPDLSNSKSKCVQITQYVTPQTDLVDLVKTHLEDTDSQTCESSDDNESVGAYNHESMKECNTKILLTGLHTCGNLAPSMLKIFEASDTVAALCNVGCCYHHLDEEFVCSPFEGDETPQQFGFPMSQFLKSQRIQLGRNARMLASQTPTRMACSGQTSHQSLFYRALLQVMLRDLTGEVSDDWQVGKIYAKSRDFADYTQRALKKLQIDDHGKWSEDVIKDYQALYFEDQKKLTAFVQLRATLAPVIETFILLDRLLYLFEQDHIGECHLVQLFDPVTSPRCYGLTAMKK